MPLDNTLPTPTDTIPEAELMESLRDEDGRVAPVVVKQERAIAQMRDAAVGALYLAKPPEVIEEEARNLDLERWSKVVARLDNNKNLKVDHNITAMGLFAMIPVAVEEKRD